MPGFLMSLISSVLPMITNAFGIDTASPETKVKLAEIELQAQKMVNDQYLAQVEVNKADAMSNDKFQSRWRPFIGWVCGIAFAYHFILAPLILLLVSITGHSVPLPDFDMNTLFTVLMGLLGLGGLRTMEKIRGV